MTHQAVPLYSFTKGIVVVRFQQQAVRQILDKIQVFESGNGLFPLLWGSSPLVGGALQVIFNVHGDDPRKEIVHDHDPDIFAPRLNAV